MKTLNETGILGENLAYNFLQKQGYKMLARNWNDDKYEIDIICETKDELVFVEVKTKKSNDKRDPSIFVDRNKQQYMIKSMKDYVNRYPTKKKIRFDVVSITIKGDDVSIRHIHPAFFYIA